MVKKLPVQNMTEAHTHTHTEKPEGARIRDCKDQT